MSKLLTERLAVVGEKRLKLSFSSSLIFAVKSNKRLSLANRLRFIAELKTEENPSFDYPFGKYNMARKGINIWQQYLACGVYAFSMFEDELRDEMQPLTQKKGTQLADLWTIYQKIYAEQLLQLGATTICREENGFNRQTVRHFITYPQSVHGEELINSMPPLLEKGYIYLNGSGEEQKTTWHRDTFLDSYFLALTSYAALFKPTEIADAFGIKQS